MTYHRLMIAFVVSSVELTLGGDNTHEADQFLARV